VLSALTTEHFVLQTANNSTYSEASARSTLYVMALSSSLVATGFVAGSSDLLVPFAAISLPAVFLLGLFTVIRLVETALESMHSWPESRASAGTIARSVPNNVVAGVGIAFLNGCSARPHRRGWMLARELPLHWR